MLWPILANSLTAASHYYYLKYWKFFLSENWVGFGNVLILSIEFGKSFHEHYWWSIPFCKKSVTSVMSILSMMNLSILKVSQFHSSFGKLLNTMLIIYEKCTFEICSSRKLIFWCHILLELCFVESNNLAQWLVVMVFYEKWKHFVYFIILYHKSNCFSKLHL